MSYIGNSPTSGAFKKLDNIGGSFNGVTSTFTLAVSGVPERAGTAQNLIISLSGVVQEPGVAYTISGTTITFSEAPAPQDDFFGVLLGSVGEVQTVTDGQITAAKLASGVVTSDKLASDAVGSTTIQDGQISTAKLADGAVTADKIAGGSVVNSVNGQTGIVVITIPTPLPPFNSGVI